MSFNRYEDPTMKRRQRAMQRDRVFQQPKVKAIPLAKPIEFPSWQILLAVVALVLSLLFVSVANARVEVLQFESTDQEDTYKSLIAELRCLVCQNQNIADSNAELAVDLRRKTYKMVQQGKSEEEIVDFMVDRYGEFVMYKPRISGKNLLLWVLPFVFLGIAVFFLIKTIAQRKKSAENEAIDQTAINRASDLLADKDQKSS